MKRLLLPFAALSLIAVIGSLLTSPSRLTEKRLERRLGQIIHECHSDYSHIRVRERSGVRSLTFVESNGMEQRQSAIDLANPHRMQLAYTKSIFASFLFRPDPSRVLIVGLGGGGMVRFLQHHFPEMQVEAVEIDPEVVRIATEYFGTKPGPATKIHTADAFAFLESPKGPFDVIYMDAFLKPPPDSDLSNLTERLKTAAFLKELHQHLKPDGLVAFNLIEGSATEDDLAAIGLAFPAVYQFGVPRTRNLITIATLDNARETEQTLRERAEALEKSLPVGLPFTQFVRHLRQ